MLQQLVLGSLIISLTIVIQVAFIAGVIWVLKHLNTWLLIPPIGLKNIALIIFVVLWLLAGLSVNTWVWVGVFLWYDAFEALEPALYFAIVTFTTVGYGDIHPAVEWRVLAALSAVNGIITFGLNTAFLVGFLSRLGKAAKSSV